MKYCPYCGAVLPDGAPSFCPECGESLPGNGTEVTSKGEPKPRKQKRPKEKKPKKAKKSSSIVEDVLPSVDDYDGYYDDRVPIDEGQRRDGLDKSIVKKWWRW